VADALLVIRLGTPADLDAVTGVYRRASLSNPGDRDLLLAHPEYLVLAPAGLAEGRTYVAERDGTIVGFATWADTDAQAVSELEDLFVDPAWMRQGVATALITYIADVIRSRGVDTIEVTGNPDALAFYHAAGFVEIGTGQTPGGSAPRLSLRLR
jgi:GNAT superfamily N-acetyltransferase